MRLEQLRPYCLSLSHTTENIQWGNDLVFKVGGKMYACAGLEPGAHWVTIEPKCSLSPKEIQQLVQKAHALVFAKLPKKLQLELAERVSSKRSTVKRKNPE